jgi:ATP-dependent RNA circularization protein (DNA/RNA ligase family)
MIFGRRRHIETQHAALGGPNGAEIALADPLIFLGIPRKRRLLSCKVTLKTAPATANFILLVKVNGSTVSTVTVTTGNTTSAAATFSDAVIPAGATLQFVVSQTGVSPDTGKDGSICWETI